MCVTNAARHGRRIRGRGRGRAREETVTRETCELPHNVRSHSHNVTESLCNDYDYDMIYDYRTRTLPDIAVSVVGILVNLYFGH